MIIKLGILENALMELLKDYKGKYAVQSFSPNSINWFKKNYPYILRGILASDCKRERKSIIEKIFIKNLFFNFFIKPDFVSYGIFSFPNKYVEKYRKKGGTVLGWTIRNKEDLEVAKKYCDNFICENFNKLNIITK